MRYVIANSTPLIALAKINELLNNVQEKLDALINVGFRIGEDL